MRLYLIAHPINKDGKNEIVDLELRDGNIHAPHAAHVLIQWTRTPNTEWKDPVVTVVGDGDQSAGEGFCKIELAGIKSLTRIMRTVDRVTDGMKDINDADEFVISLEKDGAQQAVWDSRVLKYVPIDKLKPAGEEQWIAEGIDIAVSSNAKDEDSAKGRISQELLSLARADKSLAPVLAKWLGDGMPVKRGGKGEKPEPESLGNYCKRGQQRAAAELKAKKSGKKPKAEAKAEG